MTLACGHLHSDVMKFLGSEYVGESFVATTLIVTLRSARDAWVPHNEIAVLTNPRFAETEFPKTNSTPAVGGVVRLICAPSSPPLSLLCWTLRDGTPPIHFSAKLRRAISRVNMRYPCIICLCCTPLFSATRQISRMRYPFELFESTASAALRRAKSRVLVRYPRRICFFSPQLYIPLRHSSSQTHTA